MQEKRYQGQRGTERDQPRNVLLKLRLTEKEADILNEVAERSNRPVSKIALSAITATFTFSAFMMVLKKLSEHRPDIKQIFEALEQMQKNLKEEISKRAEANPLGLMSDDDLVLANLAHQISETEITLLRFCFGANEWIELEQKKPLQQRLNF